MLSIMPRINEVTDTDLKVVERLQQLGWKLGAYIACLCVARRQALLAGVWIEHKFVIRIRG